MQHFTYGAFISVIDRLFLDYAKNVSFPFLEAMESFGLQAVFQFLDFDAGIEDDIKPVQPEMRPQGRAHPFLLYTGARNRKISFSASFFDEDAAGEAFAKSRILQALKLPWNRGDVTEPYVLETFPPPLLRLVIEQADLDLVGHLTECAVQYMAPLTEPRRNPMDPKDQDPGFINVGETLTIPGGPSRVPVREVGGGRSRLVPGQVVCTCTFIGDDNGPGNDFSIDVFETGNLTEFDAFGD